MSGFADRLRGRVEPVAGRVTGDKKFLRRGRRDDAVGKLKDAADGARDAIDDALHPPTDR